jgi:hypothetical protein
MKILSIDVGIKNMGVCILSFDEELYKLNKSKDETVLIHDIKKKQIELNDIKGNKSPKIYRKNSMKKHELDKMCFTKIVGWQNINILQTLVSDSVIHNNKCDFIQKNHKKCLSNANYYYELQNDTNQDGNKYHFYCKKHSKYSQYFLPTDEVMTRKSLQTKTIVELLELKKEKNIFFGEDNETEHKIKHNIKLYKKEVVDELYSYVNKHKLKVIKTPKSRDINLIQMGIIIKNELDKWLIHELNILKEIDVVIIENQITPIANKMKTIQCMISQYFIMNGIHNIEFISSANKLNEDFQHQLNNYIFTQADFGKQQCKINNIQNETPIQKGKEFYKDRKNAGLQLAYKILKIMEEYYYHEFTQLYLSHTKKDDLADSLLQGIWYIYNLHT